LVLQDSTEKSSLITRSKLTLRAPVLKSQLTPITSPKSKKGTPKTVSPDTPGNELNVTPKIESACDTVQASDSVKDTTISATEIAKSKNPQLNFKQSLPNAEKENDAPAKDSKQGSQVPAEGWLTHLLYTNEQTKEQIYL